MELLLWRKFSYGIKFSKFIWAWIILLINLQESQGAEIKLIRLLGGAGEVSTIINNLPPNKLFRGNNVVLKSSHLPSGAHKSWIDNNTVLSSGLLREYLFHTHNFQLEEFPTGTNTSFRLQIWRPTQKESVSGRNYTLVWQYRVTNANVISSSGILWRAIIPPSQSILLKGDEKIGWTSETDVGAISFNYVNKHHTLFRHIKEPNEYPETGQDYKFQDLPLPNIFSIGTIIGTQSEENHTSIVDELLISGVVLVILAILVVIVIRSCRNTGSHYDMHKYTDVIQSDNAHTIYNSIYDENLTPSSHYEQISDTFHAYDNNVEYSDVGDILTTQEIYETISEGNFVGCLTENSAESNTESVDQVFYLQVPEIRLDDYRQIPELPNENNIEEENAHL